MLAGLQEMYTMRLSAAHLSRAWITRLWRPLRGGSTIATNCARTHTNTSLMGSAWICI